VSPCLLSTSLAVQISPTPLNDHTHDDDVPSAVRPVGARPVGARPVLLPSVCATEGSDKPAQSVQNSDPQPGISGTDGRQKVKTRAQVQGSLHQRIKTITK
ncbi:putative mucin TcMUCII, partial [Trypanosoma cruzi]